mgnify:CR=1
MLIDAGLQVPLTPFGEFVFKVGTVSPLQKESVVAKSGVTAFVMVTLNVTEEAHCPAVGVNI